MLLFFFQVLIQNFEFSLVCAPWAENSPVTSKIEAEVVEWE